MSNIVTVRDPDVIAAEINTIKKNVREVVIYASIRIGGKLAEAKSLVDHGQWGKWLEENVEYSQSTANYLMQLYQEYGTGQESLFDTWTKSQTFAKLSYSQHIALLALPFGERQEFAESVHAEDLSTRQLQQAIRERDEARRELADTEKNLDAAYEKQLDLERELEDATGEIDELKDAAVEKTERFEEAMREAEQKITALRTRAETAEAAKARAEKSEANALSLVDKHKQQLADAKAREESVLAELKKSQENPDVPDAVMERLRKEAEADAAKKAAADLQKQLAAAEKTAQDAAQAREAAEAAAQEARGQLAAVQKQAKISDPVLLEFNYKAKKWQEDFEALEQYRQNVAITDPSNATRMKKLLAAILNNLLTVVEGE